MTSPASIARTIDREREAIVRAAVRKSGGVQLRLRADALNAYRHNGAAGALASIRRNIWNLTPVVQDAMVAGHLQGTIRSYMQAAKHDGTIKKEIAFDRAIDVATKFFMKRLELNSADLVAMAENYGAAATSATQTASKVLEEKVQTALAEVTARGGHMQDGVSAIRGAFDAAGVVPTNDYQIETIFRTQTAIGYGAGRQIANEHPAIQEILWGYSYVTVGDDRVRPNHAALDGVTLPKDDPAWRTIMPPGGFGCRCTVSEIWKDDPDASNPVPVGGVQIIDGQEVMPGPDPGWGFNPAELFNGFAGVGR